MLMKNSFVDGRWQRKQRIKMKNIIGLFLLMLIYSCGRGRETKTPSATADTAGNNSTVITSKQGTASKSVAEDESIMGTWIIRKYYFTTISAMDDKTAAEWLNKKATITDKLHFEYDQIPTYKEIFKDATDCSIVNPENPEIKTEEKYFGDQQLPPELVESKATIVKSYSTNCTDTPFGVFGITEKNEMIIEWDGAIFILNKK